MKSLSFLNWQTCCQGALFYRPQWIQVMLVIGSLGAASFMHQAHAQTQTNEFFLTGPGLQLNFQRESNRLFLHQIQRDGDAPILYSDLTNSRPGAGPIGNPLALVVREGKYACTNGMENFHVVKLSRTERRLRAYLDHDTLPLSIGLDISIEGSVITWMGQALWNGDEKLEAEFYYPLLSRVKFDSPQRDRALFPQTSGSVRAPIGTINYVQNYVGKLASPVFLVEGGGRGMAWLDDNRTDYGVDPGASSLRAFYVANSFPPTRTAAGGDDGPFLGVSHTRVFRSVSEFGGEGAYNEAEKHGDLPLKKLGDAVDLGPVQTYLYTGDWKAGAEWLRERRRWVPMRTSPATWFQRTTFVAEEGAPNRNGLGFLSMPQILEDKRKAGSDLFFIVGFSDPEIVGATGQARGDYLLPNQDLGGPDALRQGIEATHRAGGHVMYYLEGLIIWKRSRIGRAGAQEWALMERDGRYTEHYKGFWHACPADKDYQDWFAQTCAELVRTTGVDGFFIDSELATYNHRCFNPAHHHPHPDVWNWGIRQLLRRVREEVDKVNPETLLFVEGCGDIGRESGDGFIAHGHFWTENTFEEPLVRFIHPQMRAFESWGYVPRGGSVDQLRSWLIWNSVNGHRVYAHNANLDQLSSLSAQIRRYYDSFPEICDAPISPLSVPSERCLAQLFASEVPIITVGNTNGTQIEATLTVPVPGTVLLDRVDGKRVPLTNHTAKIELGPWTYRAFEVRR